MPIVDDEVNTVEVMNISSEIMKFEISGVRYKLSPRETAHIHKNYAIPRIMQEGRDPVPSVIELLTNRKVLPTSDKRVRAMTGK